MEGYTKEKQEVFSLVSRYCPKDCKYRFNGSIVCCDYFLATGKLRESEIVEGGCEKYDTGRRPAAQIVIPPKTHSTWGNMKRRSR